MGCGPTYFCSSGTCFKDGLIYPQTFYSLNTCTGQATAIGCCGSPQ